MTPVIPPTEPDAAADQRTPEHIRRANAARLGSLEEVGRAVGVSADLVDQWVSEDAA